MSCRRFRPLLAQAALGEPSLAGRQALDRHLAGCPACTAELAALAATVALLDANRPSATPAPDVWAALAPRLDSIDAERERRRWWRFVTVTPLRLAAAATLLVAAASVAVFLASRPSPPARIAAGVPVAAPLDDRVDRYLQRATPLLVALANRDAAADPDAFDGAAERRLARTLARDGRELAAELAATGGARGDDLVGDLVVLFMQLGNTSPNRYRASVALARDTIERRSLLFELSVQELRRAGEPPKYSRTALPPRASSA